MRGPDRTELHVAPGGIDSLRSPLLGPSLGLAPSGPTQALFKNAPGVFVQAARSLRSRSVQLAAPVVESSVEGSHPSPQACNMRKKSPYFRTSSFSNMAVREGLTRCARRYSAHPWASPLRGQRRRCSKTLPAFLCGQPAHCVRGLSNWQRQLSNPRSGVLIPPRRRATCEKKSPYFRTSSFSNMAVREGFEPSIRCRIHTFQACSFSHSDTSPYCLPVVDGTGANVRKSRTAVNLLFQ